MEALGDRSVHVCGWCQLRGDVNSEAELDAALAEARAYSVAWRGRWGVRQ